MASMANESRVLKKTFFKGCKKEEEEGKKSANPWVFSNSL